MEHRQKPASADLPAHIAIHPRTLTHIASHESLDRIPPWRNGRNATSRPGDLAGIYAGMGLLGSGKFLRGGTPVVKYVAIDLIWLHIVVEYHPLIDSPQIPVGVAAIEKTHLGVGIPAAMLHRLPAIKS